MADTLEAIVTEAITTCLSNLLGKKVAATVNHHLNPSLAVEDPDEYTTQLTGLAGIRPAEIILARIEALLSDKVGLEKREWKNLSECINAAKLKVISHDEK